MRGSPTGLLGGVPQTEYGETLMVSGSDSPGVRQRAYHRLSPSRVLVWAAFWLAILLPFVLVFIIVVGIASTTSFVLFCGMLSANVVALLLGHRHGLQ